MVSGGMYCVGVCTATVLGHWLMESVLTASTVDEPLFAQCIDNTVRIWYHIVVDYMEVDMTEGTRIFQVEIDTLDGGMWVIVPFGSTDTAQEATQAAEKQLNLLDDKNVELHTLRIIEAVVVQTTVASVMGSPN